MSTAFAPTALRIAAGAVVWALHFGLVYGATGVACARGMAHAVPWIVVAASAAAAAACIAIIVAESRRAGGFEAWLAAAIAAVALLAISWETLPLLWVAPCA